MAKFYGAIGYGETREVSPGVWQPTVVERKYYGDITKTSRRLENAQHTINDDISVSNTISILADPYAQNHFSAILYVNWSGVNWKVSSVEVQFPRLILSLGGVYNGEEG